MTKDQVEHAFDPFYTTRLEQGGTGLGLSTCHGIVANHGGEIEIESKERQGTTVIIELPIADMPEQGVPA
jgi:signal transduction histidine kinase